MAELQSAQNAPKDAILRSKIKKKFMVRGHLRRLVLPRVCKSWIRLCMDVNQVNQCLDAELR